MSSSSAFRRFLRWPLAALTLLIGGQLSPGLGADGDVPEYLLRASGGDIEAVVADHALDVLAGPAGDLYLVADPSARAPDELASQLRSDGRVEGFEPNQVVTLPEMTPAFVRDQSATQVFEALADDSVLEFYGRSVWSGYVTQPWLDTVRAPLAHARLRTGSGVVAVIDTGVDPAHAALAGILVPGFDFTRNLPGPGSEMPDLPQAVADAFERLRGSRRDQSVGAILEGGIVAPINASAAAILDTDAAQALQEITPIGRPPAAFGHGTMVAGVIHRVAPTARIMPLKAFRGDGVGSLFDVVRAVYHATESRVQVIAVNVDLPTESGELRRALALAAARGVVCIAPAGDDGRRRVTYPAAWPEVLGVGSVTASDGRSQFSTYGDEVSEVSAPGEQLLTTWPADQFAAAWGSSFSAAVVAGGAALLLDPAVGAGAAEAARQADVVLEALRQAQGLGPDLGSGRVDLDAAVRFRETATVP